MERKFNKHLRRWLGLPPSFISLGQLQLPLSSIVEEFKVTKCKMSLTYRDSQDQLISEAGVRIKVACKWATSTAINIGNPCTGSQGLGTAHF